MNKYILKSGNNIIAVSTNKKNIENTKRKIETDLILGIKYDKVEFTTTSFGKFPILDIVVTTW